MTRAQLRAAARRDASGVIASVPGGAGYDNRVVMAVELAMNQEWWRGYYAGIDLTRNLSAGVTDRERKRNPFMHAEDCPSHDGDECRCGAEP